MKSIIKTIGKVPFPAFKKEKVYMRPFRKNENLPKKLAHWQPTVDKLLENIETSETLYLMIDAEFVPKGGLHRREGPHIDGIWEPEARAHRGQGDNGRCGRHALDNPKKKEEAIILASNVSACVAYVGEIEGNPGSGGDMSHLDLSGLKRVKFKDEIGYIGNTTMIHESVPVKADCYRQLVRINIPHYKVCQNS